MWNKVGMSRNAEGLQSAIEEIQVLKEEFWKDVFIPGDADEMNAEFAKEFKLKVYTDKGSGRLFAADLEGNKIL